MKNLSFILKWIGVLFVAGASTLSAAYDETPLNYETQALAIFKAASGRGGPIVIKPKNGPLDQGQMRALDRIYVGLKKHTIFLKNVVWRPDLKVIRLTWANNDNSLVFKIVYKVAHDPVLTNSVYADKNDIVDVKVMFVQDGRYRYLHLDNAQGVARVSGNKVQYGASQGGSDWQASGPPVSPQSTVFTLDGHLSPEQCKFCHMLVPGVNGRPGGIFFPRYQESMPGKGGNGLEYPSFFDASQFRRINPSEAPIQLPEGLPNPILFNQVNMSGPGAKPELYTMYARTMFESPELVEAMARDNHESVCISIDFGPAAPLFGKDNYVCADGVRKTIFVKFKNPLLTTGSGEVDYAKPYYEKR